ncbi:hypothetical protein NG798_16195 [Ancylothrix sp. C2]|uniref:hypothetical protein n=1 Tax=Ancylothrix sp. D3o TaxID=2953691 RepID=UPI0021BB201D|nr:hypothetical protein [Ancylothrix sp. D3o]MCT7951343.1 hypothetical protein [Ancylothrix sp. D3o]
MRFWMVVVGWVVLGWQGRCLAEDLGLPAETIESSPVLQRWLDKVPDVLEDIENDPSFKTRLRLGFSEFPAGERAGFNVGVEDVFIGKSGLSLSGDFQGSFDGEYRSFGASLQYYLRPLGSYVNFGPVVGYRNLQTDSYERDGVNLGGRLMVVLSRGGAADLSLTQTWVKPGSGEDVGITTLSVGYAVTKNFRISADIQKQNAPEEKDSRVGVVFEWMP